MNQKAYSVLFCALLASTFVHELRAKGVAPVSSRLEVLERAASNEVCELHCTSVGVGVSYNLTIEVVANVLVIANLSANAAILIDASTSIVVLLNGASGAGVAFDLVAKTGVYIKSGLWVASSVSLQVFIQSLSGGLRAIFSISGAVTFSFTSVSSAILVVINQIIVVLVANVSGAITQDAQVGLQLVLGIGGGLVVLLNGSLKGFLALIVSGGLHISNDLAGFLNTLQGLSVVFVQVSGSLTALLQAGVVLDWSLLLNGANGLEVLVQVLLQIGGSIDLGSSLGGVLNSAESLFKLIAKLGGSFNFGISGAFLVVAEIVALINKNSTVEVVVGLIIQYVALSSQIGGSGDLNATFNAILSAFLLALEHVQGSASLSGLITIIKALIAGNLVIGGVNISVIFQKLLSVSSNPSRLVLVVIVVLQLQALIEIGVLLPYILLVLIFKLNSAIGIAELIALGINLQISGSALVGAILKNILSGIVGIILALLTGNFYDALAAVPVIGTIIVALNVAIGTASNGQFSLKALLNVSTLVKSFILGLIQLSTGIYLGISSAVIAQVKSLVEVTSSVSASIQVNVTYSASASGGIIIG